MLSFDRRGTGSCSVVQVERGTLHDARLAGLNESCAAFRTRYMASMYGREMFYSWDRWRRYVSELSSGAKRKPVVWESDFAILIPKYPWSYNICHYNRIWNFVIYVIRNLKLFVPDSDKIKTVNILFRSGYAYNENWHKGIRNATLNFLERQVGMKITVGHLRFNYQHDFQCLRRGILLGREGRIDSLPFLNDSSVWQPEMQRDDSHWPAIPHDSLWFREAVLNSTGLGTVGKYSGPGVENFLSVPVPPRRVAVLLRSERSRRRLSKQAHVWFHSTLSDICTKHSLDLVYIRNTAKLTLKQQVEQMRNVGFAVGLHGANMVNTVFMPPGGAVFEIFPWKYVRFYYASGGNSGLRYSFHEPESGIDRNCSFSTLKCFMRYRESVIFLSPNDRAVVQGRLEAAVAYIVKLHRLYPTGHMPLRRKGNSYHFGPAL